MTLGAGLALTLAACGGGDDAAEPEEPGATTSVAVGADDVPTQPATITAEAQEGDGTTVVVAGVDLPAPGFIAVHADGGGSPGPVIGVSELLPEGSSSDVTIALDEPLAADAVVYPMAHIDTNANGVYEFGSVDGVDGPAVTADGDVAVVAANVGVASSDPADSADSVDASETTDAPAGDTITISDFSFDGVTEVAVGTTVVVTNTDAAPHTWTAEDGTFDSGALSQDESFEFTFTEPGEFAYFCNFHPSMTGTIVVTG